MAWSPLIIRTVSPGRMIRASWLREFFACAVVQNAMSGGQEEVETIQVLDWVLSCPSSFRTPQLHLFDSAKFSSWSDANDSWPSFHMVIRDHQLLSSSESWSSTWSKRFSSQSSFWKELQALISNQKFQYRAFLVMIFPALNKQDLWQGIQDIPPHPQKMGQSRCIQGVSTWFNPKWLHPHWVQDQREGSKDHPEDLAPQTPAFPQKTIKNSGGAHHVFESLASCWPPGKDGNILISALCFFNSLQLWNMNHSPTLNQTCSLVDCAFPHIIPWLRLARPKWRSSNHCYVSCLNRWSLKTSWRA